MSCNNYCVYKHTSPSGKVYIGITKLKPESRWNSGRGYGKQTIFGGAIKKYGWDNFSHEILFSELTEQEAKATEIQLNAEINSTDRRFGYNETKGGEGTSGYKHTEQTIQHLRNINIGENNPIYGKQASAETKQKMSLSHRGKHTGGWKQTEEAKRKIGDAERGAQNPRAKRVRQYDLCGRFVAEYSTLTEAAIAVCGYNQHIAHCCKGSRKQHRGYIWRYATEVIK